MNIDGRRIISYGGSESIQSPTGIWSESALALLRELGIDLGRFETAFDRDLYPRLGLSRGILFRREDFGVDRLVSGDPTRMVADDIRPQQLNARSPVAFIGDFPLDAQSRSGLVALYVGKRDVLRGKPVTEKQALLATTSYRDFLTRYWGLSDAAANTFQKRPHDFFAIGIDGLPAIVAAATGYPGFRGLGLPSDPEAEAEMNEPYIHHFPDGNASIARLLVRKLLPAAAPGSTMDDIVTAPFDYSKLDVSGGKIRLRLNSTVVSLSNVAGGKVDVGYVRDGALRRVQARSAIHAGYSAMLPYMLDGMKEAQREALSASVRAPIVCVKVGVRNWTAWVKAGVHEVTNPMGFCSRIKLDYPVSLGSYRFARSPAEPMCIHMVHVPAPGLTGADQRAAFRAGRRILQSTTFAQFEANAKDELTRMLGPHGFDARRDIAAISVYRWAHGYASGGNSLYDREHDPELNIVARERIDRIAIANCDAAAEAYAHAAIDEARRAVGELTDP
jgi:spermidine dehydrogenase